MDNEPNKIPPAMLDAAIDAILKVEGYTSSIWATGEVIFAIKSKAEAALEAADVPKMLARVADYKESYRRVLAEQCASDEKHCTCVPALRARIAELEAALSRIAKWHGEFPRRNAAL